MTKRVSEAFLRLLIGNLRYLAENASSDEEELYLLALAEEIEEEPEKIAEWKLLEAIELISAE